MFFFAIYLFSFCYTALFVIVFINKIYNNFYHHIFLFRPTFRYHKSKSNECTITDTFAT